MANPYERLGIPTDADDATIRARYLRLTLEFPPESHPEQSAAIREAYERIKTVGARASDRLFPPAGEDSIEAILADARSGHAARRFTLNDLFRMAGISGR
jgi:curved DNA-binding protein CbpA